MTNQAPILEVRDLSVSLPISGRMVPVVTDLSMSISPGEAVALVGESGCGKSMTARAIIGLPPSGATVSGAQCRTSVRYRKTSCERIVRLMLSVRRVWA